LPIANCQFEKGRSLKTSSGQQEFSGPQFKIGNLQLAIGNVGVIAERL
jgi:hypothetical protein